MRFHLSNKIYQPPDKCKNIGPSGTETSIFRNT